MMMHPMVIRPDEHAVYAPGKMGKSTLYQSERLLVGLNAFEPGQEHSLHAHVGMDKVYSVVEGAGAFLLEGRELPMRAGDLLVAPDGVPHGVPTRGPHHAWCAWWGGIPALPGCWCWPSSVLPFINKVSTEGGEAPVPQGVRRENTERIRPTSNEAGRDASPAECHRIHESQHLALLPRRNRTR